MNYSSCNQWNISFYLKDRLCRDKNMYYKLKISSMIIFFGIKSQRHKTPFQFLLWLSLARVLNDLISLLLFYTVQGQLNIFAVNIFYRALENTTVAAHTAIFCSEDEGWKYLFCNCLFSVNTFSLSTSSVSLSLQIHITHVVLNV